MKKVGIITIIDNDNYGNRLQNYAMQEFLKENNVEAITIKNNKFFNHFGSFKKRFILLLRYINSKRIFIKNLCPNRLKCFKNFNKNINFSKKTYSVYSKNIKNNYDFFVVGSDQVWNPLFNNGRDPSYFLQFGSLETKRVAYAASFGVSTLEEQDVKRMKEWLKSFSAISVRETTGLRLLTSIGILGAQHVVDPVFLLSPKDWNILIQDGTSPALDYVLVYNLGQVDESIKSCAQELARKHNLSILSIEDSTKIKYADKIVESAGPIEFVRYIKAARYVVTNSFHATAFSLKFNVPFYVFIRNVTSSRISDVLSLVALQERLNVASFEMEIDWEKVNLKMENCIKSSKKFIDDILCL